MKNKGYYSWIHQLNEAAIQSQLFQRQLDEEKAKKKAGGMSGFFSTGPATSAKRKEDGGEATVPAHMTSSSRLDDATPVAPESTGTENSNLATRRPARPVELPKAPERKPRTRGQYGSKGSLTDIKDVDAKEREKIESEKSIGLEKAEQEERWTETRGPEHAELMGQMIALTRGGEEGENLTPEQAAHQVAERKARRAMGIRGEAKTDKATGKVTMQYVPADAAHWDAKLHAEYPEMAPRASDKDLEPTHDDIDGDGTYGTDEDIIADISTQDKELWGQKDASGEYFDKTQFGKLSASDRRPQSWEKAFLERRKTIAAERRQTNASRLASAEQMVQQQATTFTPGTNFTQSAGELAGSGNVERQRSAYQQSDLDKLSPEEREKAEKLQALFASTADSRAAARAEREATPSRAEEVAANAGRTQSIIRQFEDPNVKVKVKGENGEEKLISGPEYLEQERARFNTRRLPRDVGSGSTQERNAELQRKWAQRRERLSGNVSAETVQESIRNIVGRMLYG